MNRILKHKGYYGSIEYDLDSKMLFGRLLGIKGAYIYEGKTLEDLEVDFRLYVEEYLYDCEQDGIKPQKPNIGSFNIRIGTDLHVLAADKAKKSGLSLNAFVKQAIVNELSRL